MGTNVKESRKAQQAQQAQRVSPHSSARELHEHKRGRKSRPVHPVIAAALANGDRIESLPDNWDMVRDEYARPRPEWFVNESVYWEMRAEEAERKAKNFRQKAKLIAEFGSEEKRKAVTKALKLKEQFERIRKELMSLSDDPDFVDSILSDSGATETAETAE